jgi:hypothetical protein
MTDCVSRDTSPEIITLRRMAARLGVTSVWLREQAEAGTVPGLRAGRRWLFSPAAVVAAVATMATQTKGGEK